MERLSVFVTTFNNAATLAGCLDSVAFADEIVVLDSFSTDATVEIARSRGCKVAQHAFMGFGAQKQMALEMTSHEWVLLLDADEALSEQLGAEIRELLAAGPRHDGYEIPRLEQMFWRMNSPRTRLNRFLRLFRREKGRMSLMPVHAAPQVDGRIGRLEHPFFHFGERDIHEKVSKVNAYSSGLVADKVRKATRPNPWIMVFYPPLAFVKGFVFKRGFLNGWAGFITASVGAFYAFLKYAKLYEHAQFERYGERLLPPAGRTGRRRERDEVKDAAQREEERTRK